MLAFLTKVIEAPPSTRQELLDFARAEFEQHRHVNDLGHIRYLISVRMPLPLNALCTC